MRISLNLATKPFADIAPLIKNLRIAMAAMAVVAIALGYGVYALDAEAKAARAREQAQEVRIDRINRERQGYQTMMRQPDNAAVLSQAQNLNQLFDEKAFSWTLAMEDLETVLPGGVQVTTLEPTRDKNGLITLHMRVLGPRDRSIQLVANLEHSRRFIGARLVGEHDQYARSRACDASEVRQPADIRRHGEELEVIQVRHRLLVASRPPAR